ncbi:uncharacterized protein LOC143539621 [Bidens hawaiensis]|uniref:uncharacterized protein LOC143539621 n=1 Tax=Bidens hawaiensis TaxID=980011 RepID=UPI004049C7A5
MITSTPVNPQANGQAGSLNKIIINNLKKKLGEKKDKWAEELPFVLWADRTTSKNAMGQTHFFLVFETESVISTKMVILNTRSGLQSPETNNQDLANDLDVIYELQNFTRIRMAAYQQKVTKSYNKNVRVRRFQVGDLVLRKAFHKTTNPKDGKLHPNGKGHTRSKLKQGKTHINYRPWTTGFCQDPGMLFTLKSTLCKLAIYFLLVMVCTLTLLFQ